MAKGDHRRVQDQIRTQQGIAQNNMNRYNTDLQNFTGEAGQYYTEGAGRNIADYDNIMAGYNSIAGGGIGGPGGGGGGGGSFSKAQKGYEDIYGGRGHAAWDPTFRGALDKSIGTFGEFADTGGFSDQDIKNFRARAIAPTRSVFSSAQRGLNQNRALSGFSPNYAAATAKLTRDLATGIGDMNVNANAEIADMVARNRLAGASGLTQAGGTGQGLDNEISQINLQAMLAALGGMTSVGSARSAAGANDTAMRLSALRGMTDLFGTNPALAQTFGNQALAGLGMQGDLAQLQNNFGLGMINSSLSGGQVPGNFASAMGNVGAALSPISSIFGAFAPLGGGGGYKPNSMYPTGTQLS